MSGFHLDTPSTNGNGFNRTAGNGSHRVLQSNYYHGRIDDCHTHFMDFANQLSDPSAVLTLMDQLGVHRMVPFGNHIKQRWETGRREMYYRETRDKCEWNSGTDYPVFLSLQRLPEEQQCHFRPFACGISPTDRSGHRHLEYLLDFFPDSVCGIGELLLDHGLDLTGKLGSQGSGVCPNHPALEKVYQLAEDYDLPVLIHNDLRLPDEKELIGLHQLRDTLSHFPEVRFILAHGGINRGVHENQFVDILRGLLAEFHNLSIDLSWHVCWDEIEDQKTGLLPQEFCDLIESYSTRFCIGSDAVGPLDFPKNYPNMVHRMRRILGQLTPKTAQLVAFRNLDHLLPPRFRDPALATN